MGSSVRQPKVAVEQMRAFPAADLGFQTKGPWDRPGTRYFYAGPSSRSFASFGEPVDLPAGYAGHAPGERCEASCRESYFAACKASDRRDVPQDPRDGPRGRERPPVGPAASSATCAPTGRKSSTR